MKNGSANGHTERFSRPIVPLEDSIPRNIDLERGILGTLLADSWRDAELLPAVLDLVVEDDFFREGHRRVFRAIVNLHRRGQAIEAGLVHDELEHHGGLSQSDAFVLIASLLEKATTHVPCLDQCARVAELGRIRRVIETADALARDARKTGMSPEALITGAESQFRAISASGTGESDPPVVARSWPDPCAETAFHGLAGQIVRTIEPHTESDPVALLLQILVGFGNLIGRHSHFRVEATRHHTNLFAALVGQSSKARKGTSWDHVRTLLGGADPAWEGDRIQSGLSSGEGLIWAVRDPIVRRDPVKQGGRVVRYDENVADPGVDDKRLLVLETELGSTLKILTREGNSLSGTIRQSWDSGALRALTKNSPAKATGAHVSIIGHVTRDELERNLTATEAANGFANRFLWACIRRSKSLPFGGRMDQVVVTDLHRDLRMAAEFGRRDIELKRDAEADQLWASAYEGLAEGKPGLLGTAISRAEAQTMRLACLYALLERSESIRRAHLEAALALWRYCERSAQYIFGDALGDPDGDKLLSALRSSPLGLTRNQIREDVFQKNKPSAEIAQILGRLLEHGLVRCQKVDTGGKRPTETWYAINAVNAVYRAECPEPR